MLNSMSFIFQGTGTGLVIPKSIFGDKFSDDVPSPGEGASFAMQSTIATIVRESSHSPENKKKYQFLPEEPMLSERPHTSASQGQLSDLINTAVVLKCGSDFPVATKESLEQLEEMKQRLIHSKEQECSSVFEMDVEEGGKQTKNMYFMVLKSTHSKEYSIGHKKTATYY